MHEFRMSRQFLYQLRSFYRREAVRRDAARDRAAHLALPAPFQPHPERRRATAKFQKLRTHLIGEMVGRKTAEVKLRPAGLVALEWARLVTDGLGQGTEEPGRKRKERRPPRATRGGPGGRSTARRRTAQAGTRW